MNDNPRPNNFPYDKVFYVDENISLMCGKYKKAKTFSLGMRWNVSESKLGYPNIFGKSMWMVVPDKLAVLILRGLLDDENESNNFLDRKKADFYLETLEGQL